MKQFSSKQALAVGLTPLLLSLAVTNAFAADVVRTGNAGQNGAAATAPLAAGAAGKAGQSLAINPGNAGAVYNNLTVTGGRGGNGGAGGPAVQEGDAEAGTGGSGGHGGAATATTLDLTGYAGASALGGDGGHAGATPGWFNFTPASPAYGNGGNGGAATSTARTTAVGNATASAVATGGAGGNANGGAVGIAGVGGAATAAASATSLTGNVSATAVANGGAGGNGANIARRGARGGNATLNNAVRGTTTGGSVTLAQRATGGKAGDSFDTIPPYQDLVGDARGGNAVSTLVLEDNVASGLSLDIASTGGNGGALSDTGISPNAGGNASSALTLTSGRNGAGIDAQVAAVGGMGGSTPFGGGIGGNASASADLRGKSAVDGRVVATGGAGGTGGNATASLRASGAGTVRGTAEANAGAGREQWPLTRSNYGAATANLALSGDGALGAASSNGGYATSNTNVSTTGMQAVDVQSQAVANGANGADIGSAIANTVVNTVRAGISAGTAAVRAVSVALGGERIEKATATTDVRAAGDIVASSRAVGGYTSNGATDSLAGETVSTTRAITSGAHNVSVTATALSNIGDANGARAFRGNGTASAYGRSGSGIVESVAVARGGVYGYGYEEGNGHANAAATAVTTQRGGVSLARAEGEALTLNVKATAQGIAAGGGAVTYAAGARSTQGTLAQTSASSAYRDSAFQLPQLAAVSTMTAHVGAGPVNPAALGLGANVAAAIPTVLGTGVHAAGIEAPLSETPAVLATTGEFSFATDSAQRLLLGFVSSTFTGGSFDALDLTISNNGVTLLSQSFTTLAAANLFFNDHVLDLGSFGAGSQHLVINSSLTYAQQGAYAFNYVLGGGGLFRTSALGVATLDSVSAVPEPSAWLMMSLGMGGMLLVARRRKSKAVC